jgi:hypothetical protein
VVASVCERMFAADRIGQTAIIPGMKIPRSGLIALWVASALLASNVLGYWWVTWPDRTLREFCWKMQVGDIDAINGFMHGTAQWSAGTAERGGGRADELNENCGWIEFNFCEKGRLFGDRDILTRWFTSWLEAESPTLVDYALARRRFSVADGALELVVTRGCLAVPTTDTANLVRTADKRSADGQFVEAVILSRCAVGIEPDNLAAVAACFKSRIEIALKRQQGRELPVRDAMVCLDSDEVSVSNPPTPKTWDALSNWRKSTKVASGVAN